GDSSLGQAVEVELWTGPERRLRGRIREIAAAADPQARTFAARVALDADVADEVALGQSARVHVRQEGVGAGALTVPLTALQPGPSGGHAVWVVEPASATLRLAPVEPGRLGQRSEEHTSELQSRENLVCRLLLEKKKR